MTGKHKTNQQILQRNNILHYGHPRQVPAKWNNILLNFTSPKGPLHLHSTNGINSMCPSNCVKASFPQSYVPYFSLLDQLFKLSNLPSKDQLVEAKLHGESKMIQRCFDDNNDDDKGDDKNTHRS